MMAVVYFFFYGAFLQPIQTLINWKGISKYPSAAYKKNCNSHRQLPATTPISHRPRSKGNLDPWSPQSTSTPHSFRGFYDLMIDLLGRSFATGPFTTKSDMDFLLLSCIREAAAGQARGIVELAHENGC